VLGSQDVDDCPRGWGARDAGAARALRRSGGPPGPRPGQGDRARATASGRPCPDHPDPGHGRGPVPL